jgi:DNA polymerase-3 subunit beta
MERKIVLEKKTLKNIALFNPELGPSEFANVEGAIFLKVSNKELLFEILSFRYLLVGREIIESNEEIEVVLPLKKIQDIIKSFGDETKISFKIGKDNSVNLDADGIKFKIKTVEQEGRNQIPSDLGDDYVINKEEFLEGIKKVKIAMGEDEVRYYLNGINFELYKDKNGDNHLFFVSTNGHILATYGEKKEDYELVWKSIIPKKVIPDIVKVLEKSIGTIKVSFSKTKLNIKGDNLEILVKLIEAEFPDYEKVIPYKNSKNLIFGVESLKDVLSKISIVSNNDKTKNVKFNLSNNLVSMEVVGSDGNLANAEIPIEYSGENVEIILNTKYLLEILTQLDEEMFLIKFEDGSSPLLLLQRESKKMLFVLMPIRF